MLDLSSPEFWIAVFQIIAIDIMLGGDNAVVIALACRRLPESLRRQGIFWGVVGAIGLRIVLIFCALQLLALPFLKIVGGLLLLWIGMKLLQPEDPDDHQVSAGTTLAAAIKTIIVADAVMSFDNVIAVAGAAHGSIALVVFGIVVSVPIVVWGARLVLALIDRFPSVITAGGALLGWIGGGMLITDPVVPPAWRAALPHADVWVAAAGALLVIAPGKWLAARRLRRAAGGVALQGVGDNTPGE